MKVELRTSLGFAHSGDVVDLPDADAVRLIKSGQAEPVRQEARQTPERGRRKGEKAVVS